MATFVLPQNTAWSQVGGGDIKGINTVQTPRTPAPPYNEGNQGYVGQQQVYMQTPNGLVLVQGVPQQTSPIMKQVQQLPQMQQQIPQMQQQIPQMQQQMVSGGAGVSDKVFSVDAIKANYSLYSTIAIKNGSIVCPQELQCRGLTQASLENAIARVQPIKKTSDTNKIILHTLMFLFVGLLGNFFVSKHWVGNKPLRNQLQPILEGVNMQLSQQSVQVRFAWVDGSLRAYYK
jgi:flagellar hook-basal body complex protein FliE